LFDIRWPKDKVMLYDEIISAAQGVDALVHVLVFVLLDEKVISALPSSIKIIASHGAGYDAFDVKAAENRGIWASNTPHVVNNATADIAMLLILAVTRRSYESEQILRKGDWKVKGVNDFLGNDPENKILGIVGMGGIGKTLAKRAIAFDMKIIYYNRTRLSIEEERKYNAKYVTFDELLSTSDYISIHCPLNEETKNLIDKSQFDKMKTGVFFINTSRGPVVNEAALVDALKSGKVKGAGLDVFAKEPIGEGCAELRNMSNVTLLPHIGTATFESRMDMARACFQNVADVLIHKKRPTSAVNNVET